MVLYENKVLIILKGNYLETATESKIYKHRLLRADRCDIGNIHSLYLFEYE